MSIGLNDILTAIQNLVRATGAQTVAVSTSTTVTSETLVVSGKGTLVNYSVVVAGSGAGAIYNANAIAGANAANALTQVPATAGVAPCNLAFGLGLVVSPGTGQSINVTYALANSNAS